MRNSRHKTFQLLSIVVMLVALLVTWNRCAMAGGRMQTLAQAAPAGHACCGESAPVQEQRVPARQTGECCQRFTFVSNDSTVMELKAPVLFVVDQFAWLTPVVRVPEAEPATPLRSAAPPGVSWFTEEVLHRSVRSHAPPAVV